MVYSVAVAGCTGYAGGEFLRLALHHPAFSLGALTAGNSAGDRLGAHHANLGELADREVLPTSADTLKGHDIVVLALPHGASAEIARQLDDDVLVVDCGADHRLVDESEWVRYYHSDYAGHWVYGLPELPGQRHKLATTNRIAVPGCYPTNVTLSLMPAVVNGLIDGSDITIAAASGTSGAGKSLKPHLLGTELFGSMSAYGVGGSHRHIPEILQNLTLLGAENPSVSFTPMLAPMPRGILSIATAPISGVTADQLYQAYREAYDDEYFCSVMAPDIWPTTKSVQASNAFHVQVAIDERAGRMVAVGVLDNLTKGTAGGAIQSVNIALGLDERTGLSGIGVAP